MVKPDGCLYFNEHGLSDDPWIQRWQNRLTPLQRSIAEGCHLNWNIQALIEIQGFEITELKRHYMDEAPRTHGYTYQGVVKKPGSGKSKHGYRKPVDRRTWICRDASSGRLLDRFRTH